MELLAKTVLIINGSIGLGLESAKLLSRKGSNVILAGRDDSQLKKAVGQLVYGSYEVADVTRGEDLSQLFEAIRRKYDGLHALIYVATGDHAVTGTVERFLPLFERVPEAAIVIISSLPALQLYVQQLRTALREKTSIKVFVMHENSGVKAAKAARTLIRGLENNRVDL